MNCPSLEKLSCIALVVLLAFSLAGCAQDASQPSSREPILKVRVSEAFAQANVDAERIKQKRAEAAQARRNRIERERAQAAAEAEAARLEQERLEAWHNRFSTDDYTNTLLIGDSIMQNASAALRAALPGVTINADAGRSLETGGLVFENASPDKGVLDHVRADTGGYMRYVIGTGNNDYAGMPLSAAEEIIELLGPEKEIYFVTEIVTGNSRGTETTNATIADVVGRYSNVHAIDWHGLVVGHETEYLIDGCHPRADHLADYAACIKDGLDVVYP